MDMDVFEELSEPSRRYLLKEMLDGPRNVSQLVESTGLKQPNVSNHLSRLRSRGWVRASKVGRQVYYSLARADIDEAIRNYLNVERLRREDVDLHALSKEYAKAAIKGNELACAEIVERTLRSSYGLLDVFQDLLGMAMMTIGTWYKVEAIDEGQEHLATSITERMMFRVSQFYGPKAANGMVAVLACAPNNWHAIGLRMIGDYLRYAGWQVLFYGSNTPIESLVREVLDQAPHLVMFSCAAEEGVPDTLAVMRQMKRIRAGSGVFILGAGGPAVQANLEKFREEGMDFSARDLRSFAGELLPKIEACIDSGSKFDWRDRSNDSFN
jgi:methanogenic corrinoid protein MtbC1